MTRQRHLYADIDIVVKFRSQTLLHILGLISLYVKMKWRERYWESLETKQKPHIAHHSIHSVAQLRVRAQAPVFAAAQCCREINKQRKTGIIFISQNSRIISRVGQYQYIINNKDDKNILETKIRNILETKSEVIWLMNKVIPMYSIYKLLHTQENEFVVGILFKHFRFLTI